MSEAERFARRAWVTVGATGLATAVIAITGVLAARLLGPEGRGEYTVLWLVRSALGALAACGIDLWAAQRLASGASPRAVGRILRIQTAAAVGGLVGAGLIGWALLPHLGDPIGAITAATIGYVLYLLGSSWPLGQRRSGPYVGALLAQAGVPLVIVAAMLAVDRGEAPGVLLATVPGLLVATVIALATRRRSEPVRGSVERYGSALRFGIPTAAASIVTLAAFRVDVIPVLLFRGERALGLYAVAAAISEVLWFVPDAIAQVLMPHLAANPDRRDTAVLVRVTSGALLLAGLGVALVAPYAIPFIFGSDFRDAAPALWPLAFASASLAAWKLLIADLAARGSTRIRISSALACVGGMLAADLVFVPLFGIVGAGIAAAFGYTLGTVIAARAWGRAVGASATALLVPRRDDRDVLLHALRTLRRPQRRTINTDPAQ